MPRPLLEALSLFSSHFWGFFHFGFSVFKKKKLSTQLCPKIQTTRAQNIYILNRFPFPHFTGVEIKIPGVGVTPVAISTTLPAAVVQLSQLGKRGRHAISQFSKSLSLSLFLRVFCFLLSLSLSFSHSLLYYYLIFKFWFVFGPVLIYSLTSLIVLFLMKLVKAVYEISSHSFFVLIPLWF